MTKFIGSVRHRRVAQHYLLGRPEHDRRQAPRRPVQPDNRSDRRRREQDRGRQRLRERAEPGPPAAVGQQETRAPQRREQLAQIAPIERQRHDAVRAGDGAEESRRVRARSL